MTLKMAGYEMGIQKRTDLSYLVISPVVRVYSMRVVMSESVLCAVSLKQVREASN